jgi:protein PhnA
MSTDPQCPKCSSSNTYNDGNLWVCPECAHEWNPDAPAVAAAPEEDGALVVKDAFGNTLAEGDSVTVVKDLKVKGSSSTVKVGTKVRNIHLQESTDGHNISCRIDGIGSMNLKSEFVKKA